MMMTGSSLRSRREEYAEETRKALLVAGREAFAREGYQAASIDAISRAARVTKGAFYYHFKDKQALFDAVVVGLQQEASATIAGRAKSKKEIWARLIEGIDAFLDVCAAPAYGRIVVQEAELVLGHDRFREIEEAYPLALLIATLEALKQRGEIEVDDVHMLGRMIDAMICKLAVMLRQSDDPKPLRRAGRATLQRMLEPLRLER